MKINQKIMAVIYSDKDNFLLLRMNPKTMKQKGWFIVTGSIEGNETDEDAVRREIAEETGLEILDIKRSDYSCDYEWPKDSGKMRHEQAFFVKVKEAPIKLSKWEHLEYKWVGKNDFLRLIDWHGDINILKKIID